MRLSIISLLILISFQFTTSQTAIMVDAASKHPLSYASVHSTDITGNSTCNNKGLVDISIFDSTDSLCFSMLGYDDLVLACNDIADQDYKVYLNADTVNLETLHVAYTGWEELPDMSPSKIASIDYKTVQFNNPQTAADLLSLSQGVYIQKSQQGGGSPMIRGFSANRLLYTVDGVRMNTAIYRSGNLQNVISLDPFAMESTEVLFGAGSVIYGSDAIGGVMAFLTKKAKVATENNFSGNAIYRYSSANQEQTAHLDLAYNRGKWAGLTSFSRNDYGNLTMGKNGPDEYLRTSYVERIDGQDVEVQNEDPREQVNSAYTQHNVMQKISYSPNQYLDVNYDFHYSATSDYDRYDRHLRRKNDLPRYGEWYYGPQIWMMNNLSIMYTKQNILYDNMSVRLAHQQFEESRISRNFNDPIRETRLEQVQALSLNADFTKSFDTHELYYGIEGIYNKVKSTGMDENIDTQTHQKGPSRYPNAKTSAFAAYVYDQYKLNDKIDLSVGMRYSYFNIDADFDTTFYPFPYDNAQLTNGALTGNVAAIFRPSDKWLLRANLSTAFRAPNVDDMGKVFDSEPGAVVVPNADLQAEYAYNAELGLAHDFTEHIKLEASIYYTYLDNALVRRDYTLNGQDSILYDGEMSKVQATQNAAMAYVYGAQLGIDVQLPYNFTLIASYNYQKGEEELDDETMSPSRHVAPAFFNLRLCYQYKRLQAELYTQHFSELSNEDLADSEQAKDYIYAIDANGLPYCPAWYTISLKASYNFSSHFTANLGLENITNQRYRPYSSGMAGAGCNFIASIMLRF